MRTLLHLLAFAALALAARAGDLAFTLLAGPGPQVAGRTAQVELAGLNPGGQDAPFAAAPSLSGVLAVRERREPVTLTAVEAAPVAVPAAGFAARRYEFTVPPGLDGEAILTVERAPGVALRAVLTVTGSARPAAPTPAATAPPLQRLAASTPAASALARNFSGRFLPNQPIYFLYGDADQAAKFQFSFNYRLATLATGRATDTLQLGYTQRSVWDLDGKSSPFYDTSYIPEVAFSRDEPIPERPRTLTWLGWRVAFQHESNGKDATDSRSMNTLYLRPRFVVGTLGGWAFIVLPEVHAYIGGLDENPDLKDYRGYGKLRVYFGHNQGPTLLMSAWSGKSFDHATWQLDLAVPTRLRWLNLESYLYAQYFNGYGESLRDYRRRSTALRAGVAIVR